MSCSIVTPDKLSPKMTNKINKYGFRLGTTSYIIPDDIVPNVQFLANKVQDIEIVLFESHEISNLPDQESLSLLKSIALDNDLTYTVHLPLDCCLGSSSEEEREGAIEKCLRIIEITQLLDPFGFIVHFRSPISGSAKKMSLKQRDRWIVQLDRSLQELANQEVFNPELMCVETLNYPFHVIDPLIKAHDLSLCLDVGHIMLYQHPLEEYLEKYSEKCRIVHLHGIRDGKDHRDIGGLFLTYKSQIELFFNWLKKQSPQRSRVLTLEVFNENDLNRSVSCMEECF